jgi:hypothetical protein
MKRPSLLRLAAVALIAASLGACAVVPLPPPGYRAGPPAVIVETYPAYRPAPYGYGYPPPPPPRHRHRPYYPGW